jgi:hypothetical protein
MEKRQMNGELVERDVNGGRTVVIIACRVGVKGAVLHPTEGHLGQLKGKAG